MITHSTPATHETKKSIETSWVIDLANLDATDQLAIDISLSLKPGDLLTLGGDLGSGKTTFARSLIRILAENEQLEVPSPTFSLMQIYQGTNFPIVHADLYRINNPNELNELGWDEASEDAVVIVEWAERAGQFLAHDRLDITFLLEPEEGDEHRIAVLTGSGAWAKRLASMKNIAKLLDDAGWGDAKRNFMQGDASTRAYERLDNGGESGILMIAPQRPDGPPVRSGKPYSAIAKIAENVNAFVAMANALRERGFSAPKIIAQNLNAGLLLTEDLGQEFCYDENGPIYERYAEAVLVLAKLHHDLNAEAYIPDVLPLIDKATYRIPRFDLDAYLIEAELLLDWYVPREQRANFTGSPRGRFVEIWTELLNPVLKSDKTWVLRDYHSPNLLWIPEREGINRIGLIDFQDAVIGHPAYDVASLLQDARLDVSMEMELKLLSVYVRARATASASFDVPNFVQTYSIMGAQRATKILGIFARLNERDGKPVYLKHIPRIEAYLRRCLSSPELSELRSWYHHYLPHVLVEQ
jgi:N-acetylmuramate 1-kinase